jgi:hypothetical protein
MPLCKMSHRILQEPPQKSKSSKQVYNNSCKHAKTSWTKYSENTPHILHSSLQYLRPRELNGLRFQHGHLLSTCEAKGGAVNQGSAEGLHRQALACPGQRGRAVANFLGSLPSPHINFRIMFSDMCISINRVPLKISWPTQFNGFIHTQIPISLGKTTISGAKNPHHFGCWNCPFAMSEN